MLSVETAYFIKNDILLLKNTKLMQNIYIQINK